MTVVKGTQRDGMTLVEAVVAVLVLSIGLAGACALVVQANKTATMARDHYVAVNIGKNRLERARTFEFDDLYLLEETNVVVDWNGDSDPDGYYRRSTVVTNVSTNLIELIVTTEIRNRKTTDFDGEQEVMRSLYTEYQEPVE